MTAPEANRDLGIAMRAQMAEIDRIIAGLQKRRALVSAELSKLQPILHGTPAPAKQKLEYSNEFETLWALYPARGGVKVEKEAAFRKFLKITCADHAALEKAIRNYSAGADVKRGVVRDMVRFLKPDFWTVWISPTAAMLQAAREVKTPAGQPSGSTVVEEVLRHAK